MKFCEDISPHPGGFFSCELALKQTCLSNVTQEFCFVNLNNKNTKTTTLHCSYFISARDLFYTFTVDSATILPLVFDTTPTTKNNPFLSKNEWIGAQHQAKCCKYSLSIHLIC